MSATTNKKTAQGMHPQEGNKAKRPDAVPHGGPKVPQKAAPGTTKRIFGYIFQYKWHVVAIVAVHPDRCGRTSRIRAVPAIPD